MLSASRWGRRCGDAGIEERQRICPGGRLGRAGRGERVSQPFGGTGVQFGHGAGLRIRRRQSEPVSRPASGRARRGRCAVGVRLDRLARRLPNGPAHRRSPLVDPAGSFDGESSGRGSARVIRVSGDDRCLHRQSGAVAASGTGAAPVAAGVARSSGSRACSEGCGRPRRVACCSPTSTWADAGFG